MMFEKFKEKFNRKEEPVTEISFKSYDEAEKRDAFSGPSVSETQSYSQSDPHAGSVELKVIRPEAYEEVSTVAENLLAGCTVVLNLEALDRSVIKRMLDFLNGVTFCTDGEIKKVAPSTFIITPHSDIDISDM